MKGVESLGLPRLDTFQVRDAPREIVPQPTRARHNTDHRKDDYDQGAQSEGYLLVINGLMG